MWVISSGRGRLFGYIAHLCSRDEKPTIVCRSRYAIISFHSNGRGYETFVPYDRPTFVSGKTKRKRYFLQQGENRREVAWHSGIGWTCSLEDLGATSLEVTDGGEATVYKVSETIPRHI